MTVNVHRNLNWQDGLGFSVLNSSMKVIDRKMQVVLSDARFVVQPAGQARAVDTGRRNVHAFVRGELVDTPTAKPVDLQEVTYNPFSGKGFYLKETGVEVEQAPTNVWLFDGRAFIGS